MTSIGEQSKRIWMREYILHSFAKHAIFLYQKCICSKNLNSKCKTHFSDMGVKLWNELFTKKSFGLNSMIFHLASWQTKTITSILKQV